MSLKMRLLHTLLVRRGLHGVGLGVYWIVLLIIAFRTQSDNRLGDMEMMKKVGGGSNPQWCNSNNPTCATEGCDKTCPLNQVGKECDKRAQSSYESEFCNSVYGNEYCDDSSVQAACAAFYQCDCKPGVGGGGVCQVTQIYLGTNCLPTSTICSYTACPKQ